MKKILTTIIAVLAISGAIASSCYADAFVNGDFEGYVGDTNQHNSQVPPGWTTTSGTPDTFDANTNFASYTWAPSHSGGQFLHGIGWQPTWTESALQVGVSGLIVGQVYEISFEQSISRSIWSETGGFWKIKFGDEVQNSVSMAIPDYGVAVDWHWYTMYFTATQTVQTLEVIAWSDTDGRRTDIGIDGFYLGAPRENPPGENLPPTNRVPDTSSTSLLLSLSGLGLVLLRKRIVR